MDNAGKKISKPNLPTNIYFYPQIVVSKLRQQTAMAHDHRHFKAAKVPMFGSSYIF